LFGNKDQQWNNPLTCFAPASADKEADMSKLQAYLFMTPEK